MDPSIIRQNRFEELQKYREQIKESEDKWQDVSIFDMSILHIICALQKFSTFFVTLQPCFCVTIYFYISNLHNLIVNGK